MLTLTDIAVSWNESKVLHGVSCSVSEGETVGIIGPNGSGKTTLFNCISGFAPQSAGTITLRNRPIHLLPPHKRARLGLGRVFQNFGIFREMTLQDNLLLALESRWDASISIMPWTQSAKDRSCQCSALLSEIHLQDRAMTKAGLLSGGQMRLLEIMRTVAIGADILLLDEPTAGVSPRMKQDIASLIQRLQAQKKTILIIEHDLAFIQQFCSRIIVLNEGNIILDDTPKRVRTDPRLKEIYFGRDTM